MRRCAAARLRKEHTAPHLRWAKKTRRFLDGSIVQIQSVHFQGFLGCKPVVIRCKRSAEARVYAVYTAQYRLHSRFVRICLPFTYSLYHFFGTLLLEISTEPIAQYCKNRFPYDRYYIELFGLSLSAKLPFATWFRLHQPHTVCSGTPQLSAISLIVLAIRPFITPAICQYLV